MEEFKLNSVKQCHVQELGSRMRSSSENMVANVKKTSEMPKLAPQLDGLNCFETLICQ